MGGVQIKNCTAAPLKIQLCQVGVLYHALVKPGECFTRNTGAVHFTIVATVSNKDDTGWTNTVLPVALCVGSLAVTVITAGASTGLTPAALVAGTVAVTEASAMQTAGRALFGLTMEIAAKLLKEAKKEHYHISSLGWYFGGKNELEIHGGPQFVQKSEGVLEYSGSKLSIVDKNKRNRHS